MATVNSHTLLVSFLVYFQAYFLVWKAHIRKRSIVIIAVPFTLFFILGGAGFGKGNLFASGSPEVIVSSSIKTDSDFMVEDPILSDLVFNRNKTKRSLDYLRAVAKARNALVRQDYFSAVKLYSDLIVVYGEDVELLYGLAETYFSLGYQETSFSYYDKIVKSLSQNREQNGDANKSISIFEIQASYRLAYLYYQNNANDEFLRILSRIISVSGEFDEAIVALVNSQSLDYILNLFKHPLDYSYIARREIGVYYSYNGFDNTISPSNNRNIAENNETVEMTNANNDTYTRISIQKRNETAVIYLISALSMAVDTFTKYLRSTHLGYEFSTLDEMLELLQETDDGRALIQSFDIERMLIGIRKYYNYDENENSQKAFLSFYCTNLLEIINSFDNEQSSYIYSYYPNLE